MLPSSAQARLEALLRAHHAAVLAYARRRIDAELVDDVVSETFLVAWRRLDRVPAEPRAWLLAVARNVLATQRRGAGRRRALGARLAFAGPAAAAPPLLEGGPVTEALAALSEKDREALTLVAWDGLTPAEAAAVLGEPAVRFRVRLHRAAARLRRQLEPAGARIEEVVHDA